MFQQNLNVSNVIWSYLKHLTKLQTMMRHFRRVLKKRKTRQFSIDGSHKLRQACRQTFFWAFQPNLGFYLKKRLQIWGRKPGRKYKFSPNYIRAETYECKGTIMIFLHANTNFLHTIANFEELIINKFFAYHCKLLAYHCKILTYQHKFLAYHWLGKLLTSFSQTSF